MLAILLNNLRSKIGCKANINNNIAPKNDIGISFHTVFDFTDRSVIIDDTPNINKMFAMLEPIIFPRASWLLLFNAEIILIVNSGNEVPKATIVKPITKVETLNFFATLLAESTKKSAPLIKRIIPVIISNIFVITYL